LGRTGKYCGNVCSLQNEQAGVTIAPPVQYFIVIYV
jgi:hypothetical protein